MKLLYSPAARQGVIKKLLFMCYKTQVISNTLTTTQIPEIGLFY